MACPRLLPHHRIVAHHLGDGRSVRQHWHFFGRLPLELPAVFHHRRACPHAAGLKTHRRAAGQPARPDHEDGEPPPPASGVGHHWSSPWFQGVLPCALRAHPRDGTTTGTGRWREQWPHSAAPPASTGWRRSRRAKWRSSLPPFPIIKTGIDCNRNAHERHGDEHPAQGVEIRHQRQDGGLGLGQDALCDLHPSRAERCDACRPATFELLPIFWTGSGVN